MYEKLKKKYGQNFLIDQNILKKITNQITKKTLNIVEIGPGDGKLTEHILNFKPKKLTLIEIDSDLIPLLNSKFGKNKTIEIVNKDILKNKIDKEVDLIISNLPYNISSQILVNICLMEKLPTNLILMFQKEFAQRLMEKKLNSLNSLVNCFYNINTYFGVSRNCFRPIPKVDSTVLSFTKKDNSLLKINEINHFIEFKRKIFSFKRKSLGKILQKYSFIKDGIDLSKRVEEISLLELIKIFRKVNL